MARVFVSHSSDGLAVATSAALWLKQAGHSVFLDTDLHQGVAVGDAWVERLYAELARADALLAVVTSAFNESPWCSAEIGAARATGLTILPLRTDGDVASPLLPENSTQQAVLGNDGTDARERLLEALRRIDGAAADGDEAEAVYPGLAAFTTGQARMFFGRASEARRLADRLRAPTSPGSAGLLPVVGPSGCGKSSLVHAGLIPLLRGDRDWLVLAPLVPAAVPDADPVDELVRLLVAEGRGRGLGWKTREVRDALGRPGGVTELVADLLAAASARWVLLVVDQAEELLTHTAEADRRRFIAVMKEASGGRARILATVRSDFLDPLLLLAAEARLPVRDAFTLAPLNHDLMPLVIRGPARRAGITVDEELVDRIVADAEGSAALPLLAFTLAELADGVSRGGALSAERYEKLGGVDGALVRQADRALAEAIRASGQDAPTVLATLLRLVTVDIDGQVARQRVRLDELDPAARASLAVFVDHRLLTTYRDAGTADAAGQATRPVIDIAHEQVLTAWPTLREAITGSAENLRLRTAVADAADQWDHAGRPTGRLWDGDDRLPLTRHTLDPASLPPIARDFLAASAARVAAARARRVRQTATAFAVLVILLAGVSIAAALALNEAHGATRQKRTAIAGQLVAEADNLRLVDPHTALQLDLAADHIHPSAETQDALTAALTSGYRDTLTSPGGGVAPVVFSPDGRTLAVGMAVGTVQLWDLTDRSAPRRRGQPLGFSLPTDVPGPTNGIMSLAFAPNGRTLAIGGAGRVDLWDLTDRAAPRRLDRQPTVSVYGVTSVAFSPDGRTLAIGEDDTTVTLWDLAVAAGSGRVIQPLSGPVLSLAYSPDGRMLAVGGADEVALWNPVDPAGPRQLAPPLAGPVKGVKRVAFAPRGHTLAVGGDQTTLWDLTNPAAPRQLGQPSSDSGGSVVSMAFSPDGDTLATCHSGDDQIDLLDLANPAAQSWLGRSLSRRSTIVGSVAFSPDGRTLAAGNTDGTLVLWDLADRFVPHRLGRPLAGPGDSVTSMAFSPDGRTIAVSADETVAVWDVTDLSAPHERGRPLAGPAGEIWSVAFSPDGHMLAAGSADQAVTVWEMTSAGLPPGRGKSLTGALGPPLGEVTAVAFSPGGRALAAATADDETVNLWRVTGGRTESISPGKPLAHLGGPIAFAPDGRTLAAARRDNTVALSDVSDVTAPRPLGRSLTGPTDYVTSLAFSPDGRVLAAASNDRTVTLWDTTNRNSAHQLGQPLTGPDDGISSVAFSPDGTVLAAGSNDGTLTVWDMTDRSAPHLLSQPLTGLGDGVTAVAFSPDGHTLAASGQDGLVTLRDTSQLLRLRDRASAEACALPDSELPAATWSRYIPDLPYERICGHRPA